MKKVLVIIDGSNFYFKLKDLKLHNLLDFNFKKFAEFLARDSKDVKVQYYVGRVTQDGTEHSEKLHASQQKLLASLKKFQVKYTLGYLLKSDESYHEKGVDVQMAVDMLVAAYENTCDRIVLVSSDTDLAPAIKRAQHKGKVVEYIGFSHKPSVAMVRFCKESRLLTREEVKQFVTPAPRISLTARIFGKKPQQSHHEPRSHGSK